MCAAELTSNCIVCHIIVSMRRPFHFGIWVQKGTSGSCRFWFNLTASNCFGAKGLIVIWEFSDFRIKFISWKIVASFWKDDFRNPKIIIYLITPIIQKLISNLRYCFQFGTNWLLSDFINSRKYEKLARVESN